MDDGFHLFLIKILSAINLNHGLVCELRIETHKLTNQHVKSIWIGKF